MISYVPPSIHVPTFGPPSCTECLAYIPAEPPADMVVHPHIAWHVALHDRIDRLEQLVAALVTVTADLTDHAVPVGGVELPDAHRRVRAADLIRANTEREQARDAYEQLKKAGTVNG